MSMILLASRPRWYPARFDQGSPPMNTVTWIVQCLLAIVMLGAGAMKLTQSREQLMASGKMDWFEDFADSQIKGIGALEVLAAIGLIVLVNLVIVAIAVFVAVMRFGPEAF